MVNAIIVAAGLGRRMGADINKQFLKIKNIPIIIHTLEKFYNIDEIDNIIIAIRKDDEDFIKDLLFKHEFKDIHLVYGGEERQDSIYNALKYISKNKLTESRNDIILIHDGARPFIDRKVILNSIFLTEKHLCTCVGVPVKDTLKIVNSEKIISDTPNRNLLWIAQTPQSFTYDIIMKAHEYAKRENIIATDDSSLVEITGKKVRMIEGSYNNIKITTPDDMEYAEFIFDKYNNI